MSKTPMRPKHDPKPFISNRLALLCVPGDITSATGKSASRKTFPATTRRKARKTLEEVLDLPLDVVFEIASHLSPVDLLNLARTSRRFRATFMSKTALGIWKRVLERIPDLPECPKDLTHPQYASLLFEKFCMKCLQEPGRSMLISPEYALRLRLCTTCRCKLIYMGFQIQSRVQNAPKEAFSALPGTSDTIGSMLFDDGTDIEPSDEELKCRENKGRSYFVPEAELMIEELASRKVLPNGEEDLKVFLSDNEEIASRMRAEGDAMLSWHLRREQQDRDVLKDTKERRRKRILAEMKALGWEEEFHPTGKDDFMFKEWKAYLNQSKEFSPRGWKMMLAKLTTIYSENRSRKLVLRCLRSIRDDYPAFRDAQPFHEKHGMPPFLEIISSPPVKKFIEAHYETGYVKDEVEELFLEVKEHSRGFLERAKVDLLKAMKGFSANNRPTINTFDHAKALFTCDCPSCRRNSTNNKRLFSFPEIVGHWVDGHIDMGWERADRCIHTSAMIMKAAEDVLNILGLAKDSTKAQVQELGQLICRCGHRDYRGPLDFESLVYHVYKERKQYLEIKKGASPSRKELLNELATDSHRLGNLSKLIKQAAEEYESVEDAGPEDGVRAMLYCQRCYRITRVLRTVFSGWEGRWHMKSLHGKELEEGDLKASVTAVLAEARH